ncbi:kremen protein 2 isoform X2 [Hyperolius riggenbachi]|uniref:kremen protein 2 isoform X2 n=1 Tax=Hyperolius riggenbachi TaxID=752182 RepID=UPI0035A2D5A1
MSTSAGLICCNHILLHSLVSAPFSWKMLLRLLVFVLSVRSELTLPEHSECFTVNGRDYRGTVSHAGPEGIPCLYWNQTIQHRYNTQSDPSGELGLGNHNYCRNPDADVQPWCYVSETEEGIYWKYCDIPSCHMPGYLGCFVDFGSPPALSGSSGTSSKLTIQTCLQFCRRRGYQFAGVEAGYACFCGRPDDVTTLQNVSSSQCDQVCFGRPNELCGGDGKLSVYSVFVGACTGNFSSTSGVLYSPDFPDEYSPGSACSWDIRPTGSTAIEIQFRFFHVEDPNDVLEVRGGQGGGFLAQIKGGQDPPHNITFPTGHIHITFKSDRVRNGPGYVITYRALGMPVSPDSSTSATPLHLTANFLDSGIERSKQSSTRHHSSRNVWCLLAAGLSLLVVGIGYLIWRYVPCGWRSLVLASVADYSYRSILYQHQKGQSGDLTSVNQSSMKSLISPL